MRDARLKRLQAVLFHLRHSGKSKTRGLENRSEGAEAKGKRTFWSKENAL